MPCELSHDPWLPLVTAGGDRIASEPASNTVRPEFLALLDVVGYIAVAPVRQYFDCGRGVAAFRAALI
jgi:hypothetical protein